ncbi:kinesin-like protein KIF16B isoform X3 [Leptotrombidium deliense]|uniref:Kinesin-like protein KIF16B isoform X3 n=1 Tax=Leptotrombidium deliense TaxID=299467 RepID=A0A443SPX2_9ACAR|nr:kinesin-like protein KIF16B isoform X3 [Leptotrombidium deliense]
MEESERVDEELREKQHELEMIKQQSDQLRMFIIESQQKVKETEEQLRALQAEKSKITCFAADNENKNTVTNNATFDVNFNQKDVSTQEDVAVETDCEYSSKLNELKEFERQLIDMENKLKEQQTLFEIQRSKELNQIEKEKENLKEMEKQQKLDEIIEREVEKRLHEHQRRFEEEWRQGLESRAASYLRITSSPSPPSTPTQSQCNSVDFEAITTKLTFAECEDLSEAISVNIPSFVFKNSSLDPHFEYEIQINLHNESWTIFRRFRKFRDFHVYMRKLYGMKIVIPFFPPRTCFGKNSLSLAESRRRLLEKYLRELFSRCQTVKECPLYRITNTQKTVDKSDLLQFSHFFSEEFNELSALTG